MTIRHTSAAIPRQDSHYHPSRPAPDEGAGDVPNERTVQQLGTVLTFAAEHQQGMRSLFGRYILPDPIRDAIAMRAVLALHAGVPISSADLVRHFGWVANETVRRRIWELCDEGLLDRAPRKYGAAVLPSAALIAFYDRMVRAVDFAPPLSLGELIGGAA